MKKLSNWNDLKTGDLVWFIYHGRKEILFILIKKYNENKLYNLKKKEFALNGIFLNDLVENYCEKI